LKLKLENQTLKEKPTVFSLDTKFFQGEKRVLNKVGIEKK